MKNSIFESWTYFLLREGRKQDLIKKFPDDAEVIELLSNGDPSGNNKYLDWMFKIYKKDGLALESVVETVREFFDLLPKIKQKDINKYNNLGELLDTIETARQAVSKREQDAEIRKEAKVFIDDDKWLVLQPLTQRASIKYGKGTKWCISAIEYDNLFNSYTRQGKVFFFVIGKQNGRKIALEANKSSAIVSAGWDEKDVRRTPMEVADMLSPEVLSELEKLSGYKIKYDEMVPPDWWFGEDGV